MKSFVRMLCLWMLGLMLFITIWIPIGYFSAELGSFVSWLFPLLTVYYLYQAVMSLSPLGRVEANQRNVTMVPLSSPTSALQAV